MAREFEEMLESDGQADPWAAHLPGQEQVPAYLVSRYAAQYRVIVDVLLAEQDTSLTGLSYDEVAAAVHSHLTRRLPAETVESLTDPQVLPLDARLEQLERWQVVIHWQESARTGEDFLRRRDRYQLTPIAARLHSCFTAMLKIRGELRKAGRRYIPERRTFDGHTRYVRASGECSWLKDTGATYDFQNPCKAHDLCYDYVRAGIVTNGKDACDAVLVDDLFTHCKG